MAEPRPVFVAVLPVAALPAYQAAVAPYEEPGYDLAGLFSIPVVPLPGPADADPTGLACFWAPRPGRETTTAEQLAAALPITRLDAGTTDNRADFAETLAAAGLQRQQTNDTP